MYTTIEILPSASDLLFFRPAVPSPLASTLPSPPPSSPSADRSSLEPFRPLCLSPRRSATSPPASFPRSGARPSLAWPPTAPRPRISPWSRPAAKDHRDDRRRHFLRSVRDRSLDSAWQRRDIEGHCLKQTWLADQAWIESQRRAAGATAGLITDAEIDDAADFWPAVSLSSADLSFHDHSALLADEIAQRDRIELEAGLALFEEASSSAAPQPQSTPPPSSSLAYPPAVPSSPTGLEDEELDRLCVEMADRYPCALELMDTS